MVCFRRLTASGFWRLIVAMSENQPDSFYLVCVEKPNTQETRAWDEWFAFLKTLKDDPKLTETSKSLSESLWLFPAKSGVLRLSRFLELCGKCYLKPKVFFLQSEPENCE